MVIGWQGCATTRPDTPSLPERFPRHTAEEIRYHLGGGIDTLRAYTSESAMAVASPMGSMHFTSRARHRRQDSLRVDIRVQLGIEAARILLTKDSVFVYDRIKNTVFYGDISTANRLLPMPWMSPNLFLDVLGFPETSITADWTVTADVSRYFLGNEDGSVKIIVDPARWRVVRYEKRDADGRLEEEKSYLDFAVFDGILLPSRIVVRRPIDKLSATIQHRSIQVNPTSIDLTFAVKDDASYVRIN